MSDAAAQNRFAPSRADSGEQVEAHKVDARRGDRILAVATASSSVDATPRGDPKNSGANLRTISF